MALYRFYGIMVEMNVQVVFVLGTKQPRGVMDFSRALRNPC